MIRVIIITELSSGDRQMDVSAPLTSRPSLLGAFQGQEPLFQNQKADLKSHTQGCPRACATQLSELKWILLKFALTLHCESILSILKAFDSSATECQLGSPSIYKQLNSFSMDLHLHNKERSQNYLCYYIHMMNVLLFGIIFLYTNQHTKT